MDDIFVLALDPGGKVLWSERFGGPEADSPRAVAIDETGNIVLGGSFGGSIDFGGGVLTAAVGHPSAFVVQLDPGGKYLWGQTFASDDAVVNGLAIGPNGLIAATGSFAGAIDFGGGPLPTAGGNDIFVATMDSAGNVGWGRAYGGPGTERGSAVAFGVSGDMAITGTANEHLDFDKGSDIPLGLSGGPEMIYMVNLDANGFFKTGWRVGSSAPLKSAGIAFSDNLGVTIAGSFQAPISGGIKDVPPAGGWDMFLFHGR